MVSKLQYSRYLFTIPLKHNCDVATIVLKSQFTRINSQNSFQKLVTSTGCDHLQQSMDRLFEQTNRECVQNTMLRQEEIFKQQVHELHRLYRVQKLLMAELRTKEAKLHSLASANTSTAVRDTKSRYWSSSSTSETDHSYISNQPLSEYNSLHQCSTLPEDKPRRKKGFDLQQPSEEKVTSLLDRSKEVWANEECDVELTLSIGCGSGKTKSKHWLKPEPCPSDIRPERGDECSERESLQRPPSLFHAMSLN